MKMNNIQLHIYNETGSTLIENPSWDQVKKVMKQVDGINIDLIGLKVVGKGELTLMGGNEIKADAFMLFNTVRRTIPFIW